MDVVTTGKNNSRKEPMFIQYLFIYMLRCCYALLYQVGSHTICYGLVYIGLSDVCLFVVV